MEIWKDIEGYGGDYQISNKGRVRSFLMSKCCFRKVVKNHKTEYRCVRLRNRVFSIHRLVAQTFIPNPHNYTCVCHKDNDPSNNDVKNLYWGTVKMNILQCMIDGRRNTCYGEKNGRSMLKNQDIGTIRHLYNMGIKVYQLSKLYMVNWSTIDRIVKYNTWKDVK